MADTLDFSDVATNAPPLDFSDVFKNIPPPTNYPITRTVFKDLPPTTNRPAIKADMPDIPIRPISKPDEYDNLPDPDIMVDGKSTPLRALSSRYGGWKNFRYAYQSARAYREEHPEERWFNSLDPKLMNTLVPVDIDINMERRGNFGETKFNPTQVLLAGKKHIPFSLPHEMRHITQGEDIHGSYLIPDNSYYNQLDETFARLPDINAAAVREGYKFPTTPQEQMAIFKHYGLTDDPDDIPNRDAIFMKIEPLGGNVQQWLLMYLWRQPRAVQKYYWEKLSRVLPGYVSNESRNNDEMAMLFNQQ